MSQADDVPAQEPGTPEVRTGFCALVGRPNVGESTLLNALLGKRLVAVSDKPQTTRNRIVGVKNVVLDAAVAPDGPRGAQLVFVDTPGIQKGDSALRHYMHDQAMNAVAECDIAVLIVDASERRERMPRFLDAPDAADLGAALRDRKVPTVIALNKVDRVKPKQDLLPVIEAWVGGGWADVVPLSALSGDGVAPLIDVLAAKLPVGPRLFPEDMVTDRAERFLAGELIREQLFKQLGKELPYVSAVVVESFEERPSKGDVAIGAVIYVERPTQKAIVVGKGGSRIKEIGIASREAVSQLLGCPVHVALHVKVQEEWSRGTKGLRQMGYD
jgi:GTP-binding protein Era